jgi:hypothetical protein
LILGDVLVQVSDSVIAERFRRTKTCGQAKRKGYRKDYESEGEVYALPRVCHVYYLAVIAHGGAHQLALLTIVVAVEVTPVLSHACILFFGIESLHLE